MEVEEEKTPIAPWDKPDTLFIYYLRASEYHGFDEDIEAILIYHEVLDPFTNIFMMRTMDHAEWIIRIRKGEYICSGNGYYYNSVYADRVVIDIRKGHVCEKITRAYFAMIYDYNIQPNEVAARILTIFEYNMYLMDASSYSRYIKNIAKIWRRLIYPNMCDAELIKHIMRITKVMLGNPKICDFSFALTCF